MELTEAPQKCGAFFVWYCMKDLIKNPYRASQINDFKGICVGDVSPTDIDGIIEWKNKAYIIIEIKYGNKELPVGQRVAIERMVKDFYRAGKRAVAIVVEHDIWDTQRSVYVGRHPVRSVYYDTEQKWRKPSSRCTAKRFIRDYIEFVEKK